MLFLALHHPLLPPYAFPRPNSAPKGHAKKAPIDICKADRQLAHFQRIGLSSTPSSSSAPTLLPACSWKRGGSHTRPGLFLRHFVSLPFLQEACTLPPHRPLEDRIPTDQPAFFSTSTPAPAIACLSRFCFHHFRKADFLLWMSRMLTAGFRRLCHADHFL